MSVSRTKPGRRAFSLSSGSPKVARTASDGSDRNPLIDDLFEDLSANSDLDELAHLQEESVSNEGSYSEFRNRTQRLSNANSNSMRSRSNTQSRLAVDVICKTAQHFVYAMRMNELDDFFSPDTGVTAEEALHRQLSKKTRQEVEKVVQVFVELLEEVRQTRAQVAPLTMSMSLFEGRERTMSTSMFSTVSTASLMRPPVHETNQLAVAYDQQGNRMINCYTIIANLGHGAYGKVKLGVDASTGKNVAIKIINKKHLKKKISGFGANDQDAALKREIAIMKKVNHRNCVSLYEVIDDPASNKLYLIMDYVPNGPVVRLKPQQFTSVAIQTIEADAPLNGEVWNKYLIRCSVRRSVDGGNAPLTAEEASCQPTVFACKPVAQHLCALYLRQLVSGLRYMHKRHLVHHDIKPDNILLGSDHHVFLADFGVSEILSVSSSEDKETPSLDGRSSGGCSSDDEDHISGSSHGGAVCDGNSNGCCGPKLGGGTLLFTAPELFDPAVNQSEVDPYLTDVWALGVTLYCMLVGTTPFFGCTLSEVRQNILTQTYPWNNMNLYEAPLAPEWKVILDGLLEKGPNRRWTLQRLKTFLDDESFQKKMTQIAAQDAIVRAAAGAITGASSSRTAKNSHVKMPSLVAANASAKSSVGSFVCRPSPAMLMLSMDSAKAMPDVFLGFDVSQAEVSQATRAAKVEVTERKPFVSDHTREIVHRWVERTRQRLLQRNYIQAGIFSHRDVPFSAEPPSPGPLMEDAIKTGSDSNIRGHFSEVPVLTVAGHFHRTKANGVSNLAVQQRNSTSKEARQLHSRHPRVSRSSVNLGDNNNIAHSVRNCDSQSIDAILSIVNLQSGSNVFSHSLSFESSTYTTLEGSGAALPAVTETVAGVAALSPAQATLPDDKATSASASSGPNAPSTTTAEKVVWCGMGLPCSAMEHVPLKGVSASSPDDSEFRNGSRGKMRSQSNAVRGKPKIDHDSHSTAFSTVRNSPSMYNSDHKSEMGGSSRRLRKDSTGIVLRSTPTTPNTGEAFTTLPLSHNRTHISESTDKRPLQHRLSNARTQLPVFSSMERVPAVKRTQT